MKPLSLLAILVACVLSVRAYGLDSDELEDLLGYTAIAVSNVPGEFEGADFDKTVKLENGMVFEFNSYHLQLVLHPSAIVFARTYSLAELQKLQLKRPPTGPMTFYKIVIGDAIYDVFRIQ